jgi:hypothetical protein
MTRMMELPKCSKCKEFPMVPLSDYGGDRGGAAAVMWKAWSCISEKCGFSIRIDNGRVTFDKVGTDRERPPVTRR